MPNALFPPRDTIVEFPTHTVTYKPLPLADYNPFDTDPALGEALVREGLDSIHARSRPRPRDGVKPRNA
jgi:hypothetical protein